MPIEVSLNEVQEGAVLATDVLDARENVLLAAGTTLTRAHISLIGRRGIKSVKVKGDQDQDAPEDGPTNDPAKIADALQRHEHVFSKVGNRPIMVAIQRAARSHLESGNLPPG
jgi:hypothetical protein